MSKKSAKKFIEDSKHDSNLKKEFENLLASFSSNMSLQDKKSKAAEFINKHGYDVTASDLKDDIFSKTLDSSDSNELSLDELDNVAGGTLMDMTEEEREKWKNLEGKYCGRVGFVRDESDEAKEYIRLRDKRYDDCRRTGIHSWD